MNCLLVVNEMSGNANKVNEAALLKKYAEGDEVSVKRLRLPSDDYSVDGVEKLIVCGGDGTLHHALERCLSAEIPLYYYPCGTFNETAKSAENSNKNSLETFGKIGENAFAYVAAAGSFTELGQAAEQRAKRRFKMLAYFAKVLSAYKVRFVPAKIKTERICDEGIYTLLMVSNAKRCFGFRFNRLHKKSAGDLQLIAIKAPKKDNFWGRIKIFFPFFRVFFLGFSKEFKSKNVLVTSFSKGELTLLTQTPFCLDGESALLFGKTIVEKQSSAARVFLIEG